MRVTRLLDRPIIDAATCPSIGTNIQGPSLVRRPDWLEAPGRYLLYFADHKGGHIRLAWADEVTGPWTVHRPGSLQLANSHFSTKPPAATDAEIEMLRDRYRKHLGSEASIDDVLIDATTPHIASPDVHADHENRRLVMYFHGLERLGVQLTRVATSTDGIHFVAQPELLGPSYFRCFRHRNWWYALAMPGRLLRSRDGLEDFEAGPVLFEPRMRHSAVARRGDRLDVVWSRAGDAPESLLHSTIDLAGDWSTWRDEFVGEVLRPERPWEGAGRPVEPSRRGAVHGLVNQLRDPCLLVEQDHTWLLYAVGGESGIGVASVDW